MVYLIDDGIIGIDSVRIPVADWMYVPYGPYGGCWEGSLDELDRVLKLCDKYKIQVPLYIFISCPA